MGYPVTDEVNVCAEGGVSKPEKPSTPKKPSAAFYNIHGSTNTGRKGKLTIHANGLWGWTLISFSGGYVVDVKEAWHRQLRLRRGEADVQTLLNNLHVGRV